MNVSKFCVCIQSLISYSPCAIELHCYLKTIKNMSVRLIVVMAEMFFHCRGLEHRFSARTLSFKAKPALCADTRVQQKTFVCQVVPHSSTSNNQLWCI